MLVIGGAELPGALAAGVPGVYTRGTEWDPKQRAEAELQRTSEELQLEHSRRVVAAFEATAAGGSALVVLDGCLVEELHVHAARRVLALGEAVEASEAEA